MTSREELDRIAAVRAGLRCVALLVAQRVPPAELFAMVAIEAGRLLQADYTAIRRYESEDSLIVVGSWSSRDDPGYVLPVGSRWSKERLPDPLLEAGRHAPAALEDSSLGEIGRWVRERGIRSCLESSIVVEGDLWGAVAAFWRARVPHLADAERRMNDFTALVATAIANTESRAELQASRARLVAAADAARRQIERDLHDGIQQRLVNLGLDLRIAQDDVPSGHKSLQRRLSQMMGDVGSIIEDLREISRGIHPAILSSGGLELALKTLARRSVVPVELAVDLDRRVPEQIEAAAYYIVSEALTNVAKHAHASLVRIDVSADDTSVLLTIHDDGIGGADPDHGSGLIGIKDRVEALGGALQIISSTGGGTTLRAQIPGI